MSGEEVGQEPTGTGGNGTGGRTVPPHHADRVRWNTRYRGSAPTFTPHPLVAEALAAGIPDGPVLDLACGPSGNALALAAEGRSVIAVDVSDVALRQLAAEARRRGLGGRVLCVQADVPTFEPGRERFALVLATRYWDPDAFRAGCAAARPGGLVGWEALTTGSSRRWYVRHGELGERLPAGFDVLSERLVGTSRPVTRLLARRRDSGVPDFLH